MPVRREEVADELAGAEDEDVELNTECLVGEITIGQADEAAGLIRVTTGAAFSVSYGWFLKQPSTFNLKFCDEF